MIREKQIIFIANIISYLARSSCKRMLKRAEVFLRQKHAETTLSRTPFDLKGSVIQKKGLLISYMVWPTLLQLIHTHYDNGMFVQNPCRRMSHFHEAVTHTSNMVISIL